MTKQEELAALNVRFSELTDEEAEKHEELVREISQEREEHEYSEKVSCVMPYRRLIR